MSEKRELFSCQLPFAGFYYSQHDAVLDQHEERLVSDSDGDVIPALAERLFMGTDYGAVRQKYAAEWVSYLREAAGLSSLTFEELTSPREYNFQTDRVFATVSRADFARMLRAVRGERLNALVKQRFTSRSGFISSYPNHVADWPRIDEWDHNHCGTVLMAYVQKLQEDQACDFEEDFTSSMYEHYDIADWIYTAGDKNAQRAADVASYLRRRADRRFCVPAAVTP